MSCHEDMTATDPLGRSLLAGGETTRMDGPLTQAIRESAICYRNEIVEARSESAVAVHSVADHRHELSLQRLSGVHDQGSRGRTEFTRGSAPAKRAVAAISGPLRDDPELGDGLDSMVRQDMQAHVVAADRWSRSRMRPTQSTDIGLESGDLVTKDSSSTTAAESVAALLRGDPR